ncbi:methyltransferase domain-containing protein [Iodobacter sp. CM08]|uniref:methyltransferase domain-containing protein n=1 Tax=Iodobacter sp. CM08 TaxID=3085902 RepID=UPI002981FDD5|nr:methyltransferase domain-containing protein [Iodobacter sp. CM08]MDW5416964.1 methyltransferase domain-containing protein [Iodobacter sp. CM08]
MHTLDEIINRVQSYALSQNSQPAVLAVSTIESVEKYQLPWLPQSLRELIAISNPHLFIFFSYQAILGRAPDLEGAYNYHDLISSGRLSLRKFALQMLCSTESKHSGHSVKINRLDRYIIAFENKILSIWGGRRGAGVVGRIHDQIIKLSSTNIAIIQHSAILAKQNHDAEMSHKKIADTIKQQLVQIESNIAGSLNNATQDIKNNYVKLAEQQIKKTQEVRSFVHDSVKQQAEALNNTIDSFTEKLSISQEQIKQELDFNISTINKSLTDTEEKMLFISNGMINNGKTALYLNEQILKKIASNPQSTASAIIAPAEDIEVDAYYLAFEAKFRGPEDEITQKLEKYTPYVEDKLKTSQLPLLDIGMGRGEWIKLLNKKGLKAQGVDQSEEMIRHCREQNLSVVHADALDYLSNLKEQSIGAISSFHVVEHLPFEILFRLLKEAYRVLSPGGILILETPNPENVLVGSHTFYHDFSHKNPVTPTSLQFLAEYHGFKDCEILRLNPYPESAKVPGNDLLTERVNGHLCGPQDYALIAKRVGNMQ